MLRIGIVGCGIIAKKHLEAIQESSEWKVVGCADINPKALEEMRDKYGISNAYLDYQELFDQQKMDAVVVATHVDTHAAITLAAFEKGLHVMCEKPMANTTEDAEKMIRVAKEKSCLLALNFNTRSSLQYRTIKSFIDSGVLGKIRVVRVVFNWSAHQWRYQERCHQFMINGGPLIDSAVHFFDCIRWYTGQEFTRIDANGVSLGQYEHPQHGIVSCQLDDGSIALVEAGWLYTKTTKDASSFYQITVIGDEGTIEHDNVSNLLRVYTQEETIVKELKDLDKHFEVVYQSFAKSIKRGELVDLASGEDGLRATQAAYMALKSTKNTREASMA